MPPSSPGSDAAGLDAGGRHVVLVGLMGTGKTSVGRRVAQCLGRPFLDSDAQVEARTGRTVREIFESDGEAVFRELEARALADALGRCDPSVIAAAGGVVLDPANRERLRTSATAVWLRAEPSLLASRIAAGDHRPLLDDDPRQMLARMHEQRGALYDEVAGGRVVDVGSSSIEEAVDAVLELVS
jgi:shikimate kinase